MTHQPTQHTTSSRLRSVRQRLVRLTAGLTLAAASLLPATALAGTNSLTLHSSAATVTQNASFTVAVRLNAQDPIDVVQAYVTFDATKLQYQSASYSGAAWPNDTGDSAAGSGYYRASRYRTPPFTTGTLTVVTLSFRALGSSGTTNIGINTADSMALVGGVNMLTSVGSTTITLQAPPSNPTTPPPPGTTNPPDTSTNTPATSTPPSDDPADAAPTSETAVPTEEAANAANKTTDDVNKEREEAAKKSADAAAALGDNASLVASGATRKVTPIKLAIAGVGLALMATAGFLTFKRLRANQGSFVPTMDAPSTLTTPNMPDQPTPPATPNHQPTDPTEPKVIEPEHRDW